MVSLPKRKSSLDLSFDVAMDDCSLDDVVARFLEVDDSVVGVDLRLPRGNAVGSDMVL